MGGAAGAMAAPPRYRRLYPRISPEIDIDFRSRMSHRPRNQNHRRSRIKSHRRLPLGRTLRRKNRLALHPLFSKEPPAEGQGGSGSPETILREWLDCIKTRQTRTANELEGYSSSVACKWRWKRSAPRNGCGGKRLGHPWWSDTGRADLYRLPSPRPRPRDPYSIVLENFAVSEFPEMSAQYAL